MKKLHLLFVVFLFVGSFLLGCGGAKLNIVKNGLSEYKIVIPKNATDVEEKAAAELQNYLEQISGVKLSIIKDSEGYKANEIIIGKNAHLKDAGVQINTAELGEDGFVIQTAGSSLVLAGGSGKGTLYAVYGFLEDHLGCRMYAPDAVKLPDDKNVIVGEINDKQIPYFKWRETLHYFPNKSREYADWHKMHNRKDSRTDWGMWVHTFDDLVPADKYFAAHPEYFGELNGIRMQDGQLCLSNPDVLKVTVENLRKRIEEKPEAKFWSVSQNDNYNFCTCEECKKLDEKHGSNAGSLLLFVNDVAKHYPDKVISTLAYQYSRKAPVDLLPADNVNIMFCSIECNRSQPLATDPGEAEFRKDIEDWGKLTENILVWDYVVQFRNYMDPFPNLHVLQPNLQFFRDNNCRLMFQQGSGGSITEFHELRTYLIAKLLWNPDVDIDEVRKDFLDGYYGAAGPFVEKYIQKLHDSLVASGASLDIYGYPYDAINSYLTPELMMEYEAIFEKAEAAVADNATILKRVKRARLPVEFAILDISLHNVNDELSFISRKNGNSAPKKDMLNRLDDFVQGCEENGIERIEEHGYSPGQFKANVYKYVEKAGRPNLAFGKSVDVKTQFSEKYSAGGGAALTDGMFGLTDYNYNWLGFENADLEAVIDLGEPKEISELSADFLQHPLDWVFLPKWVDFSVSSDGTNFKKVAHLTHDIPQTKGKIFLHTFKTKARTNARYIKISAESLKLCPPWHRGAGQPAWIFVDEVIVN